MHIYLSASYQDSDEVKNIQKYLISQGHSITEDWTTHAIPMENRQQQADKLSYFAEKDSSAIHNADVFILLADRKEGRGKYVELGIALGESLARSEFRIYVVAEDPTHSIFFFHPGVRRVQSIEEVYKELGSF